MLLWNSELEVCWQYPLINNLAKKAPKEESEEDEAGDASEDAAEESEDDAAEESDD